MTLDLSPATTAVLTLWVEVQIFLLTQGALIFGVIATIGVVFMLFNKARSIMGAKSPKQFFSSGYKNLKEEYRRKKQIDRMINGW